MNQRQKALDDALRQIEKQFGTGSVMKLGEASSALRVQASPSGSLALDAALGIGGYPLGRMVEIFGPESSGKTTVALHAIAQIQKNGGMAAFIDAEHCLDVAYARRIGVDTDQLYLSQPDTGEEALEISEHLIRSGAVGIVVIDSVAALVPKAEIEGHMGDSHVGLQARLMSQALRKLSGAISKSGTVVLFINQLRDKIGVMFGNPETTPGGRALRFYASVRLEVRRGETIKFGQDAIGCRTKIKVVKNKVAPPFQTAELDIMYGRGFSHEGELLDLGVSSAFGQVIDKTGAWYTFNGERLGQGRENAKSFLAANPDVARLIELRLRTACFPLSPLFPGSTL